MDSPVQQDDKVITYAFARRSIRPDGLASSRVTRVNEIVDREGLGQHPADQRLDRRDPLTLGSHVDPSVQTEAGPSHSDSQHAAHKPSAQVIYPAAFHLRRPDAARLHIARRPWSGVTPPETETPEQWAAEAVRQHLAARGEAPDALSYTVGAATPAEPLEVTFDDGRFTTVRFGAGLAYAKPAAIVAPLPKPRAFWLTLLARLGR